MIIDSVVWIALKNGRDKFHAVATELLADLLSQETIYITDYIINETYAFLLRKTTNDIAISTLDLFENTPEIRILYNSEQTFQESLKIARHFSGLSTVDANILYHSKVLQLPILTFDDYMNSTFTKLRQEK